MPPREPSVYELFGTDLPKQRKARGAFFTPGPLCRFVADWAIRDSRDRVLEPSCGDAGFLLAAGDRLRSLRSSHSSNAGHRGQLAGVELHADSAAQGRARLAAAGLPASIVTGDFLSLEPVPAYESVIGNPPFVRYQEFRGEARELAREAARQSGVQLSGLASSWAAFVVHATRFLVPEGRLGMVLPAELLTVNYAEPVRRFLLERFASVSLVTFTDRVFSDVQEEVVLLLASGRGPSGQVHVGEVRDASQLLAVSLSPWTAPTEGKWSPALMPAAARDRYQHTVTGSGFCTLASWGRIALGAVTGNNSFFALSGPRAAQLGLAQKDLIPLSPPGSRHLRGLRLSLDGWHALTDQEARVWLFRPTAPSAAAQSYIRSGEEQGVHQAYKCRTRTPWWRVPVGPSVPDLFLTYMNAAAPQLSTNEAAVAHLNSVHGVHLKHELQLIGRELLPLAALNTATLLGAEVVGRAYGGGLLKLEPTEAARLPVPAPRLISTHADQLRSLRADVEHDLANGRLPAAVRRVDDVLLGPMLGEAGLSALQQGRSALARRRVARGARRAPR